MSTPREASQQGPRKLLKAQREVEHFPRLPNDYQVNGLIIPTVYVRERQALTKFGVTSAPTEINEEHVPAGALKRKHRESYCLQPKNAYPIVQRFGPLFPALKKKGFWRFVVVLSWKLII